MLVFKGEDVRFLILSKFGFGIYVFMIVMKWNVYLWYGMNIRGYDGDDLDWNGIY